MHKKRGRKIHRGKHGRCWWREQCSLHSVSGPLVTLSFLDHRSSGPVSNMPLVSGITHPSPQFVLVCTLEPPLQPTPLPPPPPPMVLWLSPHLLTQREYACFAKRNVLAPGKLVLVDEQTDSPLKSIVLRFIFRDQKGTSLRTELNSLCWYHLMRPWGALSSGFLY